MPLDDRREIVAGATARARRAPLGTLCIVASALLASSCVTPYRAVTLAGADPAHMQANRVEEEEARGLMLATTLIARPEAAARYFHRDLIERGILPVVLHIENVGPSTVEVRREEVRLMLSDEEATVLQPVDPDRVIERCRKSRAPALLGLPFVLPYLWWGARIDRFNFELARDYHAKGLPAFLRVRAGDPPIARVLFFGVEPRQVAAVSGRATLEVPVEVAALASGDRLVSGRRVPVRLLVE